MVAPIGDKSVKVQIEDLRTGDEGRKLLNFFSICTKYVLEYCTWFISILRYLDYKEAISKIEVSNG